MTSVSTMLETMTVTATATQTMLETSTMLETATVTSVATGRIFHVPLPLPRTCLNPSLLATMTEVHNNTLTQTMFETATATMTDIVNNVSAFVLQDGVRYWCDVSIWCIMGNRTLCGIPLIA